MDVRGGDAEVGSCVGRLCRIALTTKEEKLGVVVAQDPVSGGVALAQMSASKDIAEGREPGLQMFLGHAIVDVTPLPGVPETGTQEVLTSVGNWVKQRIDADSKQRERGGGGGKEGVRVTRFAPSPSGQLHLGHAYAALYAARAAKQEGRFLVRMENLDKDRCKPEYEEAIMRELKWLRLHPDPWVMRQSERADAYAAAIDKLKELGVLYSCVCSRKDIASLLDAPHGPDGIIYPGTCRQLTQAERDMKGRETMASALRIDVRKAFDITGDLSFTECGTPPEGSCAGEIPVTLESVSSSLGDAVLARKDGSPAYHLAVVVDDAEQGVTHVTRGNDLFFATPLQRLLQALLGYPTPCYDHHICILDSEGARLAKRTRPKTLQDIREEEGDSVEACVLSKDGFESFTRDTT